MTERLRVLIVDDSPDDADLLVRALRRGGYDVTWDRAEDAGSMAAMLDRDAWDLVICDVMMPQFDPKAALGLLAEREIDVPFVVASGAVGEERAAEMMRAGAHDLVLKDNPVRLVPAVRRELGEAEVRRRQRRDEAQLEKNEARFRDFAWASADWFWETDMEQRFTYFAAGENYAEMFDCEERVGRTRYELHPKAGIEPWVADEIAGYMARGEPFRDLEIRARPPGGKEVWIELSGTPVADADGRLVGYRGGGRDITEEKRARAALEESEARHRDIVEVAADWIWEMDAGLRFSFFSDRLEDATGFRPDDLLGKKRAEVPGVDESLPHWRKHLDDLANRRPFRDFRYEYRDAQGRTRAVLASGKPVFDEDGTFKGYRGTGTDITAEAELERRNTHLRALFDHMAEGVAIIDSELRVVAFNDRLLDLLDYPKDRFKPGDPLEEFARYSAEKGDYGPGDTEEHVRVRLAEVAQSKPYVTERELSDGTTLEIRGNPLPDGGYVATYADVTVRKAAERALAESEARFRALFESAVEGIFRTDADRRFLDVNPAMAAMFGFDTPEAMIDHYGDLARDYYADPGRHAEMEAQVIRDGGVSGVESQVLKSDGSTIWVAESTRPVYDAAGNNAGFEGFVTDVTERRAAEWALRERMKEIACLYDTSRIRWRLDATVADISQGVADRLPAGFQYPEITCARVSLDGTVYVSAGFAETAWRLASEIRVAHAARGRVEVFYLEERTPAHDGPFLAEEQQLLDDIAEGLSSSILYREARTALEESERRYRSIFENAAEGMYRTDAQGRFLEVNPALARMLGYESAEAFMAEEPTADAHLYAAPGTREAITARAETEGGVLGFECEARRRDGRLLWIMESAAAVRDRTGAVRGYEGFIQDITQRKEAERALRETATLLEQATRLANLGCWSWDAASDRHDYVSDQLAHLYGLDKEDYLADVGYGERFYEWFHPDDREAYRQVFTAAKQHGTPFSIEVRVTASDGEERHCREICLPVVGADGRIERLVGTLQDITEQKRQEEERAQFEARMQHLAKMEALGTMAGGVAHDFNNILLPITMMTEAAMDSLEPGSEAHSHLQNVVTAAERARDLIRQILVFSRTEDGGTAREPRDFANTVEGAIGLVRSALPHGVKLKTRIDRNVGRVVTDPMEMHQVLMNLIVNAAHAASDNTVIEVAAERVELDAAAAEAITLRPGPYVRLVVRDHGPGMDPDTLSRIFDPFFTTKPVDEGTGLGCAVVHGIVTAHGGGIDVDSVPGEGTTFRLYFPPAPSADAQPRCKEQQAAE